MASAVVLGVYACLSIWLGGIVFAVLCALASGGFIYEWLRMIVRYPTAPAPGQVAAGRPPFAHFLVSIAVSFLVGGAALFVAENAGIWAAVFAFLSAILVVAVALYESWQRGTSHGLYIRLVLALAGLLLALAVGIVPVFARIMPEVGVYIVTWMFAVVWTTDIAAYFSGRGIGGPKLWPQVSPNKTWAGMIGGTLAGTAAGVVVWQIAIWQEAVAPLPLLPVLLLSIVASLVGQGGDLAESALKRKVGVKDSGSLIPGHGGVMDRLDAFSTVCLLTGILHIVGGLPFPLSM